MKKITLIIFVVFLIFGPMLFVAVPNAYATETLTLGLSVPIVYATPAAEKIVVPAPGEKIPETDPPVIGVEVAIQRIFNAAFWLLLISAGIFFLGGAYYFLTAGQVPDNAAKGKSFITFAIIAIIIAVLARGLVVFIPRILGP